MDDLFKQLEGFSADFIGTLQEEFDFDFSVNEVRIESEEDFEKMLMEPYLKNENKIFYRGERVNRSDRPLLPTLFRNRQLLLNDKPLVNIDAEFLLNYYKSLGNYLEFCENFLSYSKEKMYELCAFSQHYIDRSPFIDFTKSLYVALSFALKGQSHPQDDIVVYTVRINESDNYTDSISTAEEWLRDYKVSVFNSPERLLKKEIKRVTPSDIRDFRTMLEESSRKASPCAKLIDIPTNDLMKHQKGVFLLLTDFRLVQKSYLTRNIREEFTFTKNIISKNICPLLLKLIKENTPWYEYSCLLDISGAARISAES